MTQSINLFIELTRLKKPIGFMLLFWPCAWGLTLAYNFENDIYVYFKYLTLFFCGSVLMRSAGCIINDIVDKNYDKKVERTKSRPIASEKISVKLGLVYAAMLCLIAFVVLIQFNKLTVLMALISMPLAFTYPLMKRFTYWPQLFLGITFNYGLVLAWIAVTNKIDLAPIVFYFGAIFWTLGYDTIYGYQDIKDDEIIGVKSTSIKFKNNPKKFLALCYIIFLISIISINQIMNFNFFCIFLVLIIAFQLFYRQIFNFNIEDRNKSLEIFKSNNLLGLLVFLNLFIGKII